MDPLTTHERIRRMYAHWEADRIPVTDSPWNATIERWQGEGMPVGASYVDFFGLDRIESIGVDNSPRYPRQVIEQTDEYVITTTNGAPRSRTGSISPPRRNLWISSSRARTNGAGPKHA